ncbi:MAG: hypothetical protein IKC01_00115 [Clostridia bacterium]|nr:hypothetical protein [Clostridia bacterium]
MKRKVISLILAALIVFASFPLSAFAAEGDAVITDVELKATASLIELYSGWYNPEENTPYFYYDLNETNPDLVITYSDGNIVRDSWSNKDNYFSYCNFEVYQSVATQLGVGEHTSDVTITGYNDDTVVATLDFVIEANPVESIEVNAKEPLMQYVDGCFSNIEDENGNVIDEYFSYFVSNSEISVTINYTNGETATYTYQLATETDIFENTGYGLVIDDNQIENPFVIGENTVKASYLGKETEFVVVVEEFPIKDISVNVPYTLEEKVSGYYDDVYEYNEETGENEIIGKYFYYTLDEELVEITVEYIDPEKSPETFTYAEFSEKFKGLTVSIDQGPENPLTVGRHTATAKIGNVSCDFEFEIKENPIKSVSLNVPYDLVENTSGYYDKIYEYNEETDQDEEVGEYFVYTLNDGLVTVTIDYTDPEKADETLTLGELYEKTGFSHNVDLGQSSDNPLTVGTHTGTIDINNVTGTFEYKIVPNPISGISVNVTEVLKEDVSGTFEGIYEYDEETGEDKKVGEYFCYRLDYDTTTITVYYSDSEKPAETYTLNEYQENFSSELIIDLGQSPENPLTAGETYTGTAKTAGVTCTFEFEIEENHIRSISAKATRTLQENKDGYYNAENEKEYFHYSVEGTHPEITVTYSDGSTKKFSYQEACQHEGGVSINIEQNGENPLTPGEHTATLEYGRRKCEFTFKIVEDPIENIIITPTRKLVENTDGYYEEYDDYSYFYYKLGNLAPEVTIKYKDGSEKKYDYLSLKRYTDMELHLEADQAENPFKCGENTATAFVGGKEYEYKFEIIRQSDSEKVQSLKVTPEQSLIENGDGWYANDVVAGTDIETPDYFYYVDGNITYTVEVTFKDGTTKTYKNVRTYDEIDGSVFYVSTNQNYENQFECGENTVCAFYRNASCEFPIEVVENTYTGITISGENELIITLTKADGSKETHKAVLFTPNGGGINTIYGFLYTESGRRFEIAFKYSSLVNGINYSDIEAEIFSENTEKALKSNILKSNKWLSLAGEKTDDINYAAATYADGYSQHFYGRDFTGLSGTITGAAVDDALSISSFGSYYMDYENFGVDEKGCFVILTLEEAQELVGKYFDVSKIDITSSPMYNAGPKEIKVYFITSFVGNISNETLKYQNGKLVTTFDYSCIVTEESYPVTIEYDDKGKVSAISYSGADCGRIATISLVNASDGVNVTYTESENATEYEIWRSTNGAEFVKIGKTSELSYFDDTAASGQTYTYKVRGINSNNEGAFSGAKTIIYLGTPTVAVTKVKTGFSIKWSKITGAGSYIVYRAEYVNGKWSSWNIISTQKASVSSYEDENVKSGVTYKYTVRAAADSSKGYYKGTKAFMFLAAPTVKIVNAKNGVKGTWNQVNGATGYIVYRSEYSDLYKKWSGWTNLGTANANAKSFTDKSATSGKLYRYTIKAKNGEDTSLYTASNTLLYLKEPVVTVSNAKDGISVKWTKSSGVTGYRIYRSEYNGKTKKWSSWKNMGTAGANKSLWVDKAVKQAVAYKYTVRAVNGKVLSSFTASASLVRLAQTTAKIAIAKTGVTVKWNKVSGAKGYTVYRSALTNGKWSSWKNMGTAKADKTSWTDKSAVSGTTYKYAVRAVNGGSKSSYVASAQLVFLKEPVVKVANSAAGVKVSWNKVSGATGYTVYSSEYNAKTKKWSSWKNRGTAKANKTSWVDKKAVSGKTYKYAVRAVNGSFKSTYTASGAILYLAQPTVKVTKTSSAVSVKWTKSAGAKSYIVYRQEKIDGNWSNWYTISTQKASVTAITDKNLEKGKEYRYTVKAVNGKTTSSYAVSSSIKK